MSSSFTIVIATCNRPDRLPATLQAIARAVAADGGGHRLIVADNGSVRSAQAVVEAFAREASFSVRYLRCPPLNRSKALNAGVAAAETEWIAFTDDDTLPDPDWLLQAARYAERGECRIFGGRIAAGQPEGPLPAWLKPGRSGRVGGHVIFVRYAPLAASGLLSRTAPLPFGANFFARRDLFARYGGFSEALWDLFGRAALGGDDTEFEVRVRDAGETIGYCHEASMVHPVHHERCHLRDQLRLAYEYGWRDPVVFIEAGRRALVPYDLRRLASLAAGMTWDGLRGDVAGAVDRLLKISRWWGTVRCRRSPQYTKWIELSLSHKPSVDGAAGRPSGDATNVEA